MSGAIQIFVDGSLQASGTSDTGDKTSRFSVIGALSDVAGDGTTRTGDNYFNGQLDEVRIYNQVLSATEIAGLSTIPGAPTITGATVAAGPVVHLTWTIPSTFTQSIEVDRKTGASGTYAALATLGGGATVFDDTTVARGTQYFYVVKAIDLAGASTSNEVNVTPPAPTIVANSVFYNNSSFDGNNGSSNLTTPPPSPPTSRHCFPGRRRRSRITRVIPRA